jgi:hypothetical protein
MYSYIYLDFGTFKAYQEALNQQVTHYLDELGNELFVIPPEGNGGVVIDTDPAKLSWML